MSQTKPAPLAHHGAGAGGLIIESHAVFISVKLVLSSTVDISY